MPRDQIHTAVASYHRLIYRTVGNILSHPESFEHEQEVRQIADYISRLLIDVQAHQYDLDEATVHEIVSTAMMARHELEVKIYRVENAPSVIETMKSGVLGLSRILLMRLPGVPVTPPPEDL